MKRHAIFILVVLISTAASAQTLFSVPEIPEVQKLKVAKNLCYNNIIMGISYAKSKGISVDEYAKYGGEQIIPFYKDSGFESIVKDQLYVWSAMTDSVNIISQSATRIVFRCSQIYPELEKQGPFWNVSFAEMMRWLEIIYSMGCETVGISYSISISTEGSEVTIEKK